LSLHSVTLIAQPPAALEREPKDSLAELKALGNIVQSSIERIEAVVTANSFTFPSSGSPSNPESEAPQMHPGILSAGSLITSAAAQLITLVRPAPLAVVDVVLQYHVSTAIRAAIATHVAEILRDAGPKGKHVTEIAKPTKVHSRKLAHVLRLLATNYIFTEVSPDVFANNRLSSVLDTGKSVEELLACPESKHTGTPGIPSHIELILDEGFKSSSYLPEALLDPELGHAYETNKTSLNKAFNIEGDYWSWLESPGNRLRSIRFGAALKSMKYITSPDNILKGYAWEALPKDSLVVDVGGGVGVHSLTVALHHPHLCFIVQDRESVVGDAVEYWKMNLPGALEAGRVKLQAHSFLESQPAQQEDVSVFLLSNVLHNWSDEYCITILKYLRVAAGPKTQLVIVEMLISCACDEPITHEITGAERPVPPKPLLRNLGRAASTAYNMGALMMGFFNGQERTVTYFRDLLNQAGWKLIAVHHEAPSVIGLHKVVAVPN